MNSLMRKMVIVYTSSGEHWFEEDGQSDPDHPFSGGYPFGGVRVPVGRYIVEDGRIKAEILATAPLPAGHEQEAIAFYRNYLEYHLRPENVLYPKAPLDNVLQAVSPERDPKAWLDGLWQVFHEMSEFKDFDEGEFRPMTET